MLLPDADAEENPLTPAQIELLVLLGETGATDTTLAETLGVSPAAVRQRFKNIASALDTHTRTEALAVARRNGWLTPPAPKPKRGGGGAKRKEKKPNKKDS